MIVRHGKSKPNSAGLPRAECQARALIRTIYVRSVSSPYRSTRSNKIALTADYITFPEGKDLQVLETCSHIVLPYPPL